MSVKILFTVAKAHAVLAGSKCAARVVSDLIALMAQALDQDTTRIYPIKCAADRMFASRLTALRERLSPRRKAAKADQ